MGSQDNLISKEFLLELNRLVSLKELQLELLDNLGNYSFAHHKSN